MAADPIKISFCTIGFQKNKWGRDRAIERPLHEILPILAEAGYDGVEIWWPHLAGLSRDEREQVRELLVALGLSVAMVSPYFDFTTSQASAQQSMTQALEVLEEAELLSARGIRVFTGKTSSQDATDEQWNRCGRALAHLCDHSAATGILWCLETHSRNLTDSVEGTLRLLQIADRPALKVIFQPSTFKDGHGQALTALAPHIAHVHATNSRAGKACRLADGDMDWRQIVQSLSRAGFRGYISVEWFGEDPQVVAREEAAYLRGLLG